MFWDPILADALIVFYMGELREWGLFDWLRSFLAKPPVPK